MKILCVIPAYWPAYHLGGPIFSVHNLNQALVKRSVDISVYTTNYGQSSDIPVNREICVDGVKVTYFAFSRFCERMGTTGWQFSLPMTRALKKNINLFDCIYIVAIWNYPVVMAAYYARRHEKPYIISPRGLLYPYATCKKSWKKWPYYQLVVKRALAGASAVHYTTKDESGKCHQALRLKNIPLVIPNGIALHEYRDLPPKEKLRVRYPALRDKKIILFLGRINWKKGLDILLKAYAALAKKRNDAHLLIAGNDEAGYLKKVKKLVKLYGLETQVTFTGMLTAQDKLEAYSGSDIFVLSSYSENFGMSVVEAMACGLAVIITNQVGIHAEVSENKAGIVIDTDADQLTGAMNYLLDNPDASKIMGLNGMDLVKKKFNLEVIADSMAEALRV